MKYYLIAGEASGDLHASNLMRALEQEDPEATFRFFGGDLMTAVGGTRVRHYRELAYMGFVPVLLHLHVILRRLKECRQDILRWVPDVVILIDYPDFNLKVARFVHRRTRIPVFYYISPKVWAWKEHRIRSIRRDVDELFSILPFEVDFFARHHYPVRYVGNPCVDAVEAFRAKGEEELGRFASDNDLPSKPIIALLAGSRRQEIKDNLPLMLRAAEPFSGTWQLLIAGAPGIEPEYYARYIKGRTGVKVLFNQTYRILRQADVALVTSGTATLETALFRIPQAVCYYTPLKHVIALLRRFVLKVPYVSLVNLIADSEVVPELVADSMTVSRLRATLQSLLHDRVYRSRMLQGYDRVIRLLGPAGASAKAAVQMVRLLRKSD